jgi:hypothetical protein
MKNPRTPEEWQEAVNLAHFYLRMKGARLYGLIYGGPTVDVARCEQILLDGRDRGFHPQPEALAGLVEALTEPAKK